MDWSERQASAERAHIARTEATADGAREDLRLAGIAGASWAAGLAALMARHDEDGSRLLGRAADEYVTSWQAAPPGSWGRPIAALRCRLMAGDLDRARDDAEAALVEGARDGSGPIAAYCAALALLVLGHDDEAAEHAGRALDEGLEPAAVAEALVALARHDGDAFAEARRGVLRSFEERDAFLEDVPVADTVLVLDELARSREMTVEPLASLLLPGSVPGSRPEED